MASLRSSFAHSLLAISLCAATACSDDPPTYAAPDTAEDTTASDVTTDASTDAAPSDVADDVSPDAPDVPDASDANTDAEPDTDPDAQPDTQVDADATDASAANCDGARVREDMGIPSLDGHALSAFVDRPETIGDTPCRLPTVLVQTPYDKETMWTGFLGPDTRSDHPLFASPDYNFVVVDWRGRFGSSDVPGGSAWYAQDGRSIVDWIVEQPWSDGQVAMWGVSALCGQQFRTAAGPSPTRDLPELEDGPPAGLAAMVPIMCSAEPRYAEVYPGGVIRHDWVATLDGLGFGVRTLYESNPRYNLAWTFGEAGLPLERVAIPTLIVAGWWDLYPRGTLASFDNLVAATADTSAADHRLLIGPWIHFATGGAVQSGAGRVLSEEERAFVDTDRVVERASLAFFDHHLRGAPAPEGDTVRYFHVGEDWVDAPSWPPASRVEQSYYLADDGALLDAPPTEDDRGTLTLPYDSADPSPTAGGPTIAPYNCLGAANPTLCLLGLTAAENLIHGPTSQAIVLERDDAALFATPPLAEPLPLLGEVRLFAEIATDLDDIDLTARLVHVHADGTAVNIGEGAARLSMWATNDEYIAPTPNTRTAIEVGFATPLAYTVPAGDRLGVIVAASNWPLFGRNPGTGAVLHEDDVAAGTPATFTWGFPSQTIDLTGPGDAGTLTVYADGASRLVVEVADR